MWQNALLEVPCTEGGPTLQETVWYQNSFPPTCEEHPTPLTPCQRLACKILLSSKVRSWWKLPRLVQSNDQGHGQILCLTFRSSTILSHSKHYLCQSLWSSKHRLGREPRPLCKPDTFGVWKKPLSRCSRVSNAWAWQNAPMSAGYFLCCHELEISIGLP